MTANRTAQLAGAGRSQKKLNAAGNLFREEAENGTFLPSPSPLMIVRSRRFLQPHQSFFERLSVDQFARLVEDADVALVGHPDRLEAAQDDVTMTVEYDNWT